MDATPYASSVPPQAAWCHQDIRTISDVERVPGWQLQGVQTSSGDLVGTREALMLGGLQILEERFGDVSVHLSGVGPSHSIVFAIPMTEAFQGKINGRPWNGAVAVGPGDRHAEALIPPNALTTLVLQRADLLAYLKPREGVDLSDWAGAHPLALTAPGLLSRARRQLADLLPALKHRFRQSETSPAQLHALQLDLLGFVADLVLGSMPIGREQKLRKGSQVEAVRDAREYILRNIDAPLRIIDICRLTRLSRRSLQQSFIDVIGTPPAQYIRAMRLDRARQLLLSEPSVQQVKEVVERLGIWHQSRFALDYRRQYGELPSATLARRR